jgi:death-on-curing protein
LRSEAPRFLTLDEVLTLHEVAIERFGGSNGVRDAGMIESALAVPMQTWGGEFLLDSIEAMAAAYWHGLAKNHGFIDGNKRISLMAADVFLQFNGLLMTLSEEEAEAVTLRIATSELDRDEIAALIRENVVPFSG